MLTCKLKSITVIKPIQECSEYIFGIGFWGKLCESKTAFNAITVMTNTKKCTAAWMSFRGRFKVYLPILYTNIAKNNFIFKLDYFEGDYNKVYLHCAYKNIKPIVINRGCQLNSREGLLCQATPPRKLKTQMKTNKIIIRPITVAIQYKNLNLFTIWWSFRASISSPLK